MTVDRTAPQANKDVVRRWVERMVNRGDLDAADELCAPILAKSARRWVAPFRAAFPDVHMREVTLIAEGDQVVGRYTCSATHLGEWRGHPPTGHRFDLSGVGDDVAVAGQRRVPEGVQLVPQGGHGGGVEPVDPPRPGGALRDQAGVWPPIEGATGCRLPPSACTRRRRWSRSWGSSPHG